MVREDSQRRKVWQGKPFSSLKLRTARRVMKWLLPSIASVWHSRAWVDCATLKPPSVGRYLYANNDLEHRRRALSLFLIISQEFAARKEERETQQHFFDVRKTSRLFTAEVKNRLHRLRRTWDCGM